MIVDHQNQVSVRSMNNAPMGPSVLLEVKGKVRLLVRDWRDVSVDVRFGMSHHIVIQSSFRIII